MPKEPTRKECEDKGMILRSGYKRKSYKRKTYTKCPPKKSGCKPEEKIVVPEAIIEKTYVPATCIEDTGKKGKTPEKQKWAPQVLKGELHSFALLPVDKKIPFDDQNECIKIGLRAKEIAIDTGMPDYSELSGKFLYVSNLNVNKNPELSFNAEKCRQEALIAYDPTQLPQSKKHPERNLTTKEIENVKERIPELKPEAIESLEKERKKYNKK